MPFEYARNLTGRRRTRHGNRQLGLWLAFNAGAANAGGFLAVQQYTSHMTGIVSSMADNLALGATDLALGGLGALLSFLFGAMCSTIMINISRRRHMHSQYALPLALEAVLLLCFGVLGAQMMAVPGLFVPLTVMLLCFIMGLQNAMVTKLSNSEVRTTHVTGTVTDIGIELGKLIYVNRLQRPGEKPVRANRERLLINSLLVCCFFIGGVSGAFGFKCFGFLATVPLAGALLFFALVPMWDDLRLSWTLWRRKR
ncbi:YoaK family protein [Pseudomonas sp. FIP_A4]|uniref:YoaK family protein n=1 Tax=Pseudomonas sp. FIP_A4 TaxID=3070684 RepID=UPI002FD3EC4C